MMLKTEKKPTIATNHKPTSAFVAPKAQGQVAPFFQATRKKTSPPAVTIDTLQDKQDKQQAAVLPLLPEKKARQQGNILKKTPEFDLLLGQIEQKALLLQQHPSAQTKAEDAQLAAEAPKNEKLSLAQNTQISDTQKAPTPPFRRETFKQLLYTKIAEITPQSESELKNYNQAQGQKLSTDITADVVQETQNNTENLATANQQIPSTDKIPDSKVIPLKADKPIKLEKLNAVQAVPPKVSGKVISMTENPDKLAKQMQNADLTNQQLTQDPTFTTALSAKNKLDQNSQVAPGIYRQNEQQIGEQAEQQNQQNLDKQLSSMANLRQEGLRQVGKQQQNTQKRTTNQRAQVAAHINSIYLKTQQKVNTQLQNLHTKATQTFEQGAKNALQEFKDTVKENTESWIRAALSWLGLLDDFKAAAQKFQKIMATLIDKVADIVSDGIDQAKQNLAEGKQEIQQYINTLPKNLQQIGTEEAQHIQTKFDGLEQDIQQKQNNLIDTLAQSYHATQQAFEHEWQQAKEANKSIWQQATDALNGVIDTINNLKKLLTEVLHTGKAALKALIANPIAFLKNLISGVGQGFKNFANNLPTHLKQGLMEWLFGEATKSGIAMPQSFDTKALFVFVMELLGITYQKFRQIAVNVLGEKTITIAEKSVTLFVQFAQKGVAGIWEYAQEQFTALKQNIMEQIKTMIQTTIIQAGIKNLMAMLTPASAFIKACTTVYDIIVFLVSKTQQIGAIIKTISAAILAIAEGKVGAVAAAIEKTLARTLPLVIGFLANLLGIGKISTKLRQILQKVQDKIEKILTRLIHKAVSLFKKGVDFTKNVAKKVFDKFLILLGLKKTFVGKDNKQHTLFFEPKGDDMELMVASEKQPLKDILKRISKSNPKEAPKIKYLVNRIHKSKTKLSTNEAENIEIRNDINERLEALATIFKNITLGRKKNMDKVHIKFTNNYYGIYQEFEGQLIEQQNELNSMTIHKWFANRYIYIEKGRISDMKFRRNTATYITYKEFEKHQKNKKIISESIIKQNWHEYRLAATHSLDQVVGGEHDKISGMGNYSVNSSIGSQWKEKVKIIEEEVDKVDPSVYGEEKIKVNLSLSQPDKET